MKKFCALNWFGERNKRLVWWCFVRKELKLKQIINICKKAEECREPCRQSDSKQK